MNETDIDALAHRRHRSRALTVAMRVPPREYERSYKELQGVTVGAQKRAVLPVSRVR